MSKITKKFLFYFIMTISLVVGLCIILCLALFYKFSYSQQYNSLKTESGIILSAYEDNHPYRSSDIRGILMRSGSLNSIWATQGPSMHKMKGHGNPFDSCSRSSIKITDDTLTFPDGTEYMYYMRKTPYGDLYVLKDKVAMNSYMNIAYLIIAGIFILGLLVSIPMGIFLGRRFTSPLIQLKENAEAVASGNYSSYRDITPLPEDEIGELALSMDNMKNQLQRKDKFQREFIANVSHDLKTPLSIIRSSCEAIADGLLDNEGNTAFAKGSINQVDRLTNMVNDIMKLSKLQGMDSNVNLTWVDCHEFLSSIESDMNLFFKKESLNFKLISPDNIDNLEVLIDRDNLRRCIFNFLSNAAKVSPKGGNVTLKVSDESSSLLFSVEDEGPGIPPHLLSSIWDRYTKNSESGGMGLGLAICREILNLHGFSYTAENSHDSGAVFTFTIPPENIRIKNTLS